MVLRLYDNVRRLLGVAHGQERPTSKRSLRRGYDDQFSVKDREILEVSVIFLAILITSFVIPNIRGSAGIRLWGSNFRSSRPQLQEVQLKEERQGCWMSVLSITDDKTDRNAEIDVFFRICSESSVTATKLQLIYVDKATEEAFHFNQPNVYGGSFQKILNEVPCIKKGCPPVSVSGDYIGIPTIDGRKQVNYYIFLLPTLAPRKHGVIPNPRDSAASAAAIDELWNDIIIYFGYRVIEISVLIIVAALPLLSTLRRWLRYEQERQVLDSTNCTARLSLVDEDDVIIEITDIPSPDPGNAIPEENTAQATDRPPDDQEWGVYHPIGSGLHRCNSCPNLRRRLFPHTSGEVITVDDIVLRHQRRSMESSDCESLVSIYQEEDGSRGTSKFVLPRSEGWYTSGTSDESSDGISDGNSDDTKSVSTESVESKRSSNSSFFPIEDTGNPPRDIVTFPTTGVVFDVFSEAERKDPVGGE
jgi:hypothetical protein